MLILLFSLVEFTAVNSPLTDTLVSGQFYLCTLFNSPFANKKKIRLGCVALTEQHKRSDRLGSNLQLFTGSKLSVFFCFLFFFYINQSPT